MAKLAKLSIGLLSQTSSYECAFDWPDNCFVQAGDRGIVFTSGGSYSTAFFEAFPRDPDTFIRGEGVSVVEAEQQAWKQYEATLHCPGHEFERRGYTNGAGFCKHCGIFCHDAFQPSTLCKVCGRPTNWTQDLDGNYYCEEHQREMPLEKWTWMHWDIARSENDMWYAKHELEELL